ncbi:MAG: esterase [Candidatus Eremiobacteraeota bacterium]|nr:esterase [Candidatus Eremiobacteraeota bacterium]
MRRFVAFATFVVLCSSSPLSGCASAAAGSTLAVESSGVRREYVLHVPPSYDGRRPVPLVFAFHGGGGQAAGMERMSGMDAVADREGFIVAYPQGLDHHWNDGRTADASKADDVSFIKALVSDLEAHYAIDQRRIYATGISNGAFFSFRLACDLSNTFAAVAPVAGSLPAGFAGGCQNSPVSVLMINGTADPLVLYAGGHIGGRFVAGGDSVAVSQAAATWASIDRCDAMPRDSALQSDDPSDTTTTRVSSYERCAGGTSVQLYTIDGGGHTWPDGPQYLPQAIIGPVSRDFDASATIWQFFSAHPKA